MNSETIMQTDVLDIIFDKRNKLYGAYTLRKFYNHRLFKSIGITLGVATFLCAFTFIPDRKHGGAAIPEMLVTTITQIKEDVKPPKELPKPKQPVAPQKKLMPPTIVANNVKTDTLSEITPEDRISSVNVTGDPAAHTPVAPSAPEGTGEAATVAIPVADKTIPVDHPEVQPSYPGGIDALRKFLEHNLVNPKEMEEGEMVSVNVSFVVGFDGKLQRFAVVKDGGDIFNREVIRVLKKMPDWVPGKAKGENVAVNFTIPIKFVPAD
ncbi:energy transducer TonB [Ferruginibacter paludis]|uniref:energy transducer TonB n=1 Tax=Ferruginibacter paludis TaxID=1310417 RepID=UPI0025B3442A|nr:energy transducer TonB [Ferruginibacter paludis]MDN3654540.1 energy transducer TonB [Ferruginibacter paludis]